MKTKSMYRVLAILTAGALVALAPKTEAAEASVLDGISHRIERAFQVNDPAAVQVELAKCDAHLASNPDDATALYYRGLILVTRATFESPEEHTKALRKQLFDGASKALEKSQKLAPSGETMALYAASLERSISARGGLAMMSYGPKAVGAHDDALELAPESPRVWMLRGTSLYFRPGFVGGSVEEALAAFQKAVALFEAEAKSGAVEDSRPVWGHAEAWAWVGQAYARLGQKEQARVAYARGLELAPDYRWIRDGLLPQVQ